MRNLRRKLLDGSLAALQKNIQNWNKGPKLTLQYYGSHVQPNSGILCEEKSNPYTPEEKAQAGVLPFHACVALPHAAQPPTSSRSHTDDLSK